MGKKNNSYTASYRLAVISFAEQFGNRAARREFGILESTVRYWRKQNELLKNAKSDSRAFRYRKLENPHVLRSPIFQRPNWKKSVQIMRVNTVFV
jgi:transposase-like protein